MKTRIVSLFLALTLGLALLCPAGAAEAQISTPFADLPEKAWYTPAVEDVLSRGLMNGVAPDTFRPDGTLTRAMAVTVLWRLAGEPEAAQPSPFTDVPPGIWYEEATAWAAETGAVEGFAPDTFGPEKAVTREQLAVIFHRWAESQGFSTLLEQCYEDLTIDTFPVIDLDQVSSWAEAGVTWAVRHHLISPKWPEGVPEHIPSITLALEAAQPASRAEVAVFLSRLCQTFLDEAASLPPAAVTICSNDDGSPYLVVTTPDPTGEGTRSVVLHTALAHQRELMYTCRLETTPPEFTDCTVPNTPFAKLEDATQTPSFITYWLTYDRQGNPAFVNVVTTIPFERTCFALHYEKTDAGWVLTGVNRDRNDLWIF